MKNVELVGNQFAVNMFGPGKEKESLKIRGVFGQLKFQFTAGFVKCLSLIGDSGFQGI